MRWLNNPRYQKSIQKLASIDPSRKAIFDTVVADEHFADADMRNRLKLMDLEARKVAQKRDYSTQSDILGIQKDTGRTAEKMGWWNMGLSGLLGLQNLSEKKRTAGTLRELASKYK